MYIEFIVNLRVSTLVALVKMRKSTLKFNLSIENNNSIFGPNSVISSTTTKFGTFKKLLKFTNLCNFA